MSHFWRGWIRGTRAAYIGGALLCLGMLIATERLVFLLACAICVAAAHIAHRFMIATATE